MDHFYQIRGIGPETDPMLEAYSTLAAIAARTKTVRLGTLVTGVTYRNPAILAKTVTTLDVISGGRAILGLGAAWNEDEHAGYGVDFPPIGERMDRLDEALTIAKAMFTEDRPSFTGRLYRIERALNVPEPIQPGGPKILVGGGGEQRTLKIAAQHADMTHWFPLGLEVLRHKTEVLAAPLRGHRARPGDDPADDGDAGPARRERARRGTAARHAAAGAAGPRQARDAGAGRGGAAAVPGRGVLGLHLQQHRVADARVDRPWRRAPAPRQLMRPFRFLAEAGGIADGKALAADARRAEAMGIDVLVLPDHLIEQLAPIPFMATVAAATERLRIGTFVLNNDLRHPAVLAQDLASLDVLSGGRLEIGIGRAGTCEYQAIGLPFEPVGVRVSRLGEAIAVLKGAFAPGPFSFSGDHYAIADYDADPKPVQQPHPPFFIGGGGRRF